MTRLELKVLRARVACLDTAAVSEYASALSRVVADADLAILASLTQEQLRTLQRKLVEVITAPF